MVSLIACTLSAVSKLVPSQYTYHIHPYDIPLPQQFHKHLEATFLQQYEEILIIGDIHGCFDELQQLLEQADAAKDSVLKIFVGDLLRKGPKNEEVLNLVMNNPSMISVRGNHDEVVIREYFESKIPEYELSAENEWIRSLNMDQIRFLIELPYTIHIPTVNSVVVHAGLMPDTNIDDTIPMDMVAMRNIIVKDYFWDGGLFATKETTEGDPWAALWRGPQHVYFGHDAGRKLQCYPYATGLDTGCVYGDWLTGVFISGPRKGQFIKQKAFKTYRQSKKALKSLSM